jgi:AcrR family transcriptional regulator
MSRSKRLSGVQRRAQLIEVGCKVFAEHGYSATSVEEIARAAKVSKPIIYEHFGGKEGLYAVIVDREMETLYRLMSSSISAGSPRKLFEQAVLAFLDYVDERPDGFAVLTRNAPVTAGGGGMRLVMSDVGVRVREVFEEQFVKAGYDPRYAPIYAQSLIGMVTLAGQWWVEAKELPKREVARHVAALGWMGLRHLPKNPSLGEGSD